MTRWANDLFLLHGEAALSVKVDRVRHDVRGDLCATTLYCEILSECQQHSAMPAPLGMRIDGYSTEERVRRRNVDADDSDCHSTVLQDLRMVPCGVLVGVVLVVGLASGIEQDAAAKCVIFAPLAGLDRRRELPPQA